MQKHVFPVQIYYEDTDFSGVVYHANYLKYCERAREHLLGIEHLVRLYDDHGIGFVVYKAALTYKEGAKHGDALEVHTQVRMESPYRLIFEQNIFRSNQEKPLVLCDIDLVCVDADQQLVKIPEIVLNFLSLKVN